MIIEYNAEPTMARFHCSKAFVKGIRGPIGSGKSVACCFEGINRSLHQTPVDGKRRTRAAILRNCYDDQTEILTAKGWKLFKDLDANESVAQLKDGFLEFVEISYYYAAPYNGNMLGFKSEGVDFLVTPDHRMIVSKIRTRKKVWDDYHFEIASDIYGKTGYRVKRDAEWIGEDTPYSEDFFKWLGFWFAEGSSGIYGGNRHQCVITQDPSRFDPSILFEKANLPYTVADRPDGDCKTYRLSATRQTKGLIKLLSTYGKSTNKAVPSWIKNAPKGHIRAFIDGFALGDGHKRKNSVTWHLFTSSKQLADDFQEMALRAGLVANLASRDRSNDIATSKFKPTCPEYTLTILCEKKHRPQLQVIHANNKKKLGWYEKEYDGTVYCVEVPTHAVYVRRNGKAFWCSQTYPELKSTTIKTWIDWFDPFTRITYGAPITGYFSMTLPDKTICEIEIYFLALDKIKDIKKLKSLELSWCWMNEAIEMPQAVLNMATGRVNRHPAKKDGGATTPGVFMDTNSCDIDNWWYTLSEEEKPKTWEFFDQPAALIKTETGYIPNPEAENIDNLSGGYEYYLNQLPGKPKEWVKVFILNQYGSSDPGSLVYGDEYCKLNHTDKVFDPSLKHILWTHDQNYTPLSSAIIQRDGKDNIYVVDEIVLKSAVARQSAQEFCERYKDHKDCIVVIYGDSYGHKGEKHGHQSDYLEIEQILKKSGFRVKIKVPRSNPAIKDGQNSLRAKIVDALGYRSFFVNPKKCKYVDKGLSTLQLKKGSTFQEEDSEYQHITTALRYFTDVEFPIKNRKSVSFNPMG